MFLTQHFLQPIRGNKTIDVVLSTSPELEKSLNVFENKLTSNIYQRGDTGKLPSVETKFKRWNSGFLELLRVMSSMTANQFKAITLNKSPCVKNFFHIFH